MFRAIELASSACRNLGREMLMIIIIRRSLNPAGMQRRKSAAPNGRRVQRLDQLIAASMMSERKINDRPLKWHVNRMLT
jgi:hypothetical protein